MEKDKYSKDNIAILYEHPEWFKPLFSILDRNNIQYTPIKAHSSFFDVQDQNFPYSILFNRLSPSAHTRGNIASIFYGSQYLYYLENLGVRIINGYKSHDYEFSKAKQLNLLNSLGIKYPKARVINDVSKILKASEGLMFPIIIKPNVGGSGAGILKFNTKKELKEFVKLNSLNMGIDHTALVQEYLPARNNSVVRIEILNEQFLYAIKLHLESEDTFNLCPADYCDIQEKNTKSTKDGVSERRLLIESYKPANDVIEKVKRITKNAGIEVGGVEYLINDRDGELYYYDINALSNFVKNPLEIIGFDPFINLVDYLKNVLKQVRNST